MTRKTADPLTDKHRLAAELIAEGHGNRAICERLNIGESTLLRWKRRKDFRALIEGLLPPGESSPLKEYSTEILENARDDEAILMADLRELLEGIAKVVGGRLKNMSEDEIREMPVRLIPTFLNAFTDGLGSLQNAHDRVSGYGLLIRELGAILEGSDTTTKTD